MRRKKPRNLGAVIRLISLTVPPLTRMLFRLRWRHLDRIPARGGAILVANHVSYIDPLVMATAVWDGGRVSRFLGKASLFSLPVLGPLLHRAGQIPVSRGTREAAQSLDAAVESLRRGEVIVMYPEGTVTRDPDFWPTNGKTGAARLALLVPELPLIPVGQWGAQDAVDVYHRRYRLIPRKTVTVSVGEPIDLSGFVGHSPTGAELHELTKVIMTAITTEVATARGVAAPTVAPEPVTGSPAAALESVASESVALESIAPESIASEPITDSPLRSGT
ncbi:MAG: 1-acyl-sn-glycerol-3-phosphate acyltransferase [Pseudonocardiales bacterium]|nr:1-acyl-sn-glycerol-3-phosphate acyltransferase [Pseudonocardiales bacterium]